MKPSTISDYLDRAGVPAELRNKAIATILEADVRSAGLTWAKWKVRLFKAGKIARMLAWSDERLVQRDSTLADWDVAPMYNITAHGDNIPWTNDGAGARPQPGAWLNRDPQSAEYQEAVAANYWLPGTHPRSMESRKAWYRRNAGEFRAYRNGMTVDLFGGARSWTSPDGSVTVMNSGAAWLIKARRKLIGRLGINTRVGFELDNIFTPSGAQGWYPVSGYQLLAPVTWSVLPSMKA